MKTGTITDFDSSESHGFSAASHEVSGFEAGHYFGHRHADIEIHCWDRPTQFLLAGRIISLPADTPIVFWAGNPHFLMRPPTNELSHIFWITLPVAWLRLWNLSPDFVGELLSGRAMQPADAGNWGQRIREWVALIQAEGQGKQVASLEIQALLVRMQLRHTTAKQTTSIPTMPLAVEKALVWLLDHFKEAETARDVSEALSYNHKYLMTAFRQHVGQTLHVYLNQLRIMEAQRLLLQTDESITHIALECGFNSLGRFYASFKKVCGQTPRQFRESLRKA